MNVIVDHSKGSGDIEQAQNCWVHPITLKCDFTLSEIK